MPVQSQSQGRAMFAAAQGKSTLGIPKAVGQEFVGASQGQPMSSLPEHVQAQQGAKRKSRTHRGRRGRGKSATAHHTEAKTHIASAQQAQKPAQALSHLFKAVRSLHAAKQATAPEIAPLSQQ